MRQIEALQLVHSATAALPHRRPLAVEPNSIVQNSVISSWIPAFERKLLCISNPRTIVGYTTCTTGKPGFSNLCCSRRGTGGNRWEWSGCCVCFCAAWFHLSDPAVEEALYDSAVLRQFVGIDLGRRPVPDETTACKFRHLLEEHHLGARIFERVQEHLQAKGFRIATGTIVDATILRAEFNQERDGAARSGDAPDAQRKALVFRDLL